MKGRAGLRAWLPSVVSTEASAEASTQRRDETSHESKTERHHTAASLFNLLYEYLIEDGQLVMLQAPDQLDILRSGQLVEIAGEYLGNPLEDVLAYFGAMLPYLREQEEMQNAALVKAASGVRNQRSGDPAKRAASAPDDSARILEAAVAQAEESQKQFGFQMMSRMANDIAQVPVHDLLLKTEEGLHAVLTVASEYYSAATNESLRAGEFRVVGKVTKVIKGDRIINLTRRTVIGAAGPEMARDMMKAVNNGTTQMGVADPIVDAPAVQILPMAIFL